MMLRRVSRLPAAVLAEDWSPKESSFMLQQAKLAGLKTAA